MDLNLRETGSPKQDAKGLDEEIGVLISKEALAYARRERQICLQSSKVDQLAEKLSFVNMPELQSAKITFNLHAQGLNAPISSQPTQRSLPPGFCHSVRKLATTTLNANISLLHMTNKISLETLFRSIAEAMFDIHHPRFGAKDRQTGIVMMTEDLNDCLL
eukprot:SAG11_NODE_8702_length_986_cov_0.792559_1_plen_160_part_01